MAGKRVQTCSVLNLLFAFSPSFYPYQDSDVGHGSRSPLNHVAMSLLDKPVPLEMAKLLVAAKDGVPTPRRVESQIQPRDIYHLSSNQNAVEFHLRQQLFVSNHEVLTLAIRWSSFLNLKELNDQPRRHTIGPVGSPSTSCLKIEDRGGCPECQVD